MNMFEFRNNDIPFLKKDCIIKSIFAFTLICSFVWQLVLMILQINSAKLDIIEIVATVISLPMSAMFVVVILTTVFKNFKIIKVINEKGKCASSADFVFKTDKTSFVGMYSIITKIFATIITLVLVCSIIFSIIQLEVYSAMMSYYIPLLLTIAVSTYYCIYSINFQSILNKKVEEYNRL